MSDDTTPHRTSAAHDTPGALSGAARPPADDDVLGSAETLMTRFTAQLTVQLAHLRPFPEPVASPAPAARRVPTPERA